VKKNRATAEIVSNDALESIKKMAIVAMFSDDELMDHLVLKGGNAMDMIYEVNSRGSVDLDFSLRGDLDIAGAQSKVERALRNTFELEGYLAFDIKASARPNKMPDELAAFWGGYLVEFKLIALKRAKDVDFEIDTMRREAIKLGKGPTFEIDISRHEYTEDMQQHELLGYRIYVYSPEMIVCEKLRAICQQMPEYADVIKRNGLGNQRARDFIDIEALVKKFGIDVGSERAKYVVRQMFEIKRVPLELIPKISATKGFHALGFEEVRAAMKPGVKLEPFEYYFDFVVEQCMKLESLWHV
jgi:predicted nucleotidyltransferase component of viral defense system